jgi:catalase
VTESIDAELPRIVKQAGAAWGTLSRMERGLAQTVIDTIVADAPASDLRALHAKGTLCAATFTPAPEAARLSRAPHFSGAPCRAHVRFSNGSGVIGADYAPREGRGMAVKIYLPGGGTTDVVAVTLPAFFVRTPEDFLEFVHARKPDPATGEPDAERIGAFVGAHPEALTALAAVVGAEPTDSYLSCAYNALHTYLFENADGTTVAGRYHLEPAAGTATISPDEAGQRGHDHLKDDLAERLARAPAVYVLSVSLANEGDVLDDPTVAWPDDNERVVVGRFEITELARDREQDGDVLVFDPTRVTDGIGLSNDPILHFRREAYAASVLRRSGLDLAADQ